MSASLRFSGALRGLRALARCELRDLWRHRGRSLLIVLLIAVPVAAVVGGGSLHAITQPTVEEKRSAELGQAMLAVTGGERSAVASRLPTDTPIETVEWSAVAVEVPGRRLRVAAVAADPDGLARGIVERIGGRRPDAAGEVALTRPLFEALDVEIGQRVSVDGEAREVVGEVRDPETLSGMFVLSPPVTGHSAGVGSSGGRQQHLFDVPAEEAEHWTAVLRGAGFRVTFRSEIGPSDGFEELVFFIVGGLGLFEAGLVVAAAFAVGFRRRQRELGLLGATGASIAGMRVALLVSAAALAVLGGLLGVAVGSGATALVHPFLDGWNDRANGAFELSTLHIGGALLLGLVASVAAAAVPAWGATRLPVRVALSGRRPLSRGAGAWLVAGGILFALAVVLVPWGASARTVTGTFAMLAGSVLGVLGLGCASPWLLALLARAAGPMPLPWRLAVRDAGRFRARNGPVVTAVLAGASLCILISSFVGSVDELIDVKAEIRDDQILVGGVAAEAVVGQVRERAPVLAASPLRAVRSQEGPLRARFPAAERPSLQASWVACGDERLLACAGLAVPEGDSLVDVAPVHGARSGEPVADWLASFAKGAFVVGLEPGPQRSAEGASVFTGNGKELESVGEFLVATVDQDVRTPAVFLHEAALESRGLSAGPPPGHEVVPWILRLARPVDSECIEWVRALAAAQPATWVDAQVLHGSPTATFLAVVMLITFATGLIVIFIATSLCAVESAADARTLHTLGTPRSGLRRLQAARAGYLALLGCTLAVPAGLLPAAGLLSFSNVPLNFVMPWTQITATVLGLPAIAYAGTWVHALLRGSVRPALAP